MKIGVLSDTHGELRTTQRAIHALNGFSVDLLIHCGDVGTEVVPLMSQCVVHFVCGNVDDPAALHETVRDPKHTLHEPLGILEIADCRIAFLHGDDIKLLKHTIHSGNWDLVCHGHTHAFEKSLYHQTLVLNPGAISRTPQPSVAVVELPSLEVRQIPL
jgi:putative phosphoesterase